MGIRWRSPAKVLALFGGGALLIEAALAVLLLGLDAEASSPVRTAILLGWPASSHWSPRSSCSRPLTRAGCLPRRGGSSCLRAAAVVGLPAPRALLGAVLPARAADSRRGSRPAARLAAGRDAVDLAAILAWRQARISPSAWPEVYLGSNRGVPGPSRTGHGPHHLRVYGVWARPVTSSIAALPLTCSTASSITHTRFHSPSISASAASR